MTTYNIIELARAAGIQIETDGAGRPWPRQTVNTQGNFCGILFPWQCLNEKEDV